MTTATAKRLVPADSVVLSPEDAEWLASQVEGAFSALWLHASGLPYGDTGSVSDRRKKALALLRPEKP